MSPDIRAIVEMAQENRRLLHRTLNRYLMAFWIGAMVTIALIAVAIWSTW